MPTPTPAEERDPKSTPAQPGAAEREQLETEARSAYEVLRAAQSAYDTLTRRLLIASIHELLAEQPYIAELSISSEYCTDDEGGYFRSVTGEPVELPAGVEAPEGWDEYLWSDTLSSCEASQEVIAELFALSDAEGKSTLSRSALLALAS